jgi:coproporphyrinogen III oxidase-like Fe-S oxidoreductase
VRAGAAAVEEAARAFDTFNIDLMYALPGQTLDELARTSHGAELQAAAPVDLPPDDRANTVFATRRRRVPDDDLASDMLDLITERAPALPAWSATRSRPMPGPATAARTT